MSPERIDLLVVDDHMIIRRGLVQILSEADGIGELREAADGPAAMRALRERPVAVVLLDIALGERDGMDVLKAIRAEFPAVGVVMLSVYPETQFGVRAIRAGAGAYLNKGCSPDELLGAIRRVAGGGVYVTPAIADLLARSVRRDDDRPPHESLSNREFQVLELLAGGLRCPTSPSASACPATPSRPIARASSTSSGCAASSNWPTTPPATISCAERRTAARRHGFCRRV